MSEARRVAVYLLALACSFYCMSGCTVAKVTRAYLLPTSSFYKCTEDLRIECQPGSEKLAQVILPAIKQAQRTVEEGQYCVFTKPMIIRTYASREDFSRFSGSVGYAEGAVSFGVLHLSPKLLATPERIPGIVTHELSHLNLALIMGTWSWASIPGWFHEGLATWVSAGGGAETVTNEEALKSIKAGHSFSPEDYGSPLAPKSAASYDLKPHMYYRQAAIFVEYLHNSNPAAFKQLLLSIEHGQSFSQGLRGAYGEDVDTLWRGFLVKI
ncbi:hypothetical protein AAKU61_000499 [Undibacterium sp. GrIS 1.2]|uniref:hypothetical protein n=1 Tax=Undibacterium sp. GrIS 1.2 TaxID=3143933 RepID=UPI0033980A40